MVNIVKAMEVEKEYLENKLQDREPFHLVDAIKECGFKTLDEYFKVKRRHQFKQLEFAVKNITQEEVASELATVFENGTVGLWLCDHPKTCVFGGVQGLNNFNEEYCIENNITIYPYLSNGGIIVHQDGDFTYGLSCPENIGIDAGYILDATRYILQKHTVKKVTVDGNDILVDGLKVCGSTVYNKNSLFLILVYFSFNDKSDLINAICKKEVVKAPSYIDFMTREQLKQEVLAWINSVSI